MKLRILLIAVVVAAFAGVYILSAGFMVKTGNIGLIINQFSGRVDPHIRHAGFNPQMPFMGNELIEIPTHARTYTMVQDSQEGTHPGDDSVMANTASANTVRVDTSITYHIAYDPHHPERILDLFNKYRQQFANYDTFEELQLRPVFRQAVVDAFSREGTSECMTGDGKRQAADYALNELNTHFQPDSIVIDEVRIRTVYPDDATRDALRSRLQAQQNLTLSKLNLQLQELVNQKAILAAQAEAQANHLRAQSLTPRLVKFRHIKDIEIVAVPRNTIINAGSDSTASSESTTTNQGSSQ
jgi:regulator of protease activity HflC (stomatin/prohibitin superfamily)